MDHADSSALLRAATRNDFYAFSRRAFQVVSPGAPLLANWHLQALAYELEQCRLGNTKRLIINMPPRHCKSIFGSVALPAFILGHDPKQTVLCASYSQALAGKFSRDCRAVMEQPWYREAFPTRLSSEKNTEGEFLTTERGFRLATSVTGTLTGRGANFVIVDDPLNAAEANSANARNRVNDWFDKALLSRLDDQKTGVVIVIMQRLHIDDLTGHLLETAGRWRHVSFPAIAEEGRGYRTGHEMAHFRKTGAILHPDHLPESELERIAAELGSTAFSAQYQQQPVPADSDHFKWDWIQFFKAQPDRPEGARVIQSWDTASSPGSTGDYSVCTTWLAVRKHNYLLDVKRGRWAYPELKQLLIAHAKAWSPQSILIENSSNGRSLIQDLRDWGPSGITSVTAKDNKESRFYAVTSLIEAGEVFMPEDAPWLADVRQELLTFPGGKHDDIVDSISQYLNWIRKNRLAVADVANMEGPKLFTPDRTPGQETYLEYIDGPMNYDTDEFR